MNKIIKSPYFILFLLAAVSLLVAFFLVKTPLSGNGDFPSYLEAMKFLKGESYNEEFILNRVLISPLMLYASIFFGYFTGSDSSGMMAVNIIFYFLIIFVFYRIVELIYKSKKVALLSSILFFANYCMFNYGTTYRVDISSWFFFLLSTFFALKYYYSRLEDKKSFYLSILSASIGVLFKEYGLLGMFSLSFLILLSQVSFKEKIKKVFQAGSLFIIIPGLYYLLFYYKFNYSYLHWYFQNINWYINDPETATSQYGFVLLIKVLGWLFLVGWPIFIWGLYQEYKNFDKTRAKVLLAILPASLSFLVWPALTQRIAFIFVPWLALISGYGLSKIKSKYIIIVILLIYVVVNYLTRPWLLKMINF